MTCKMYIVLAMLAFILTYASCLPLSPNDENDSASGCLEMVNAATLKCVNNGLAERFGCLQRELIKIKQCIALVSQSQNTAIHKTIFDKTEKRGCAGNCWGRFYQCGTLAGNTLDQLSCIQSREACMHLCR